MGNEEPSGQQAVEHLRAVLRASQTVAYRDATGLRFGDAVPAYADAVEFLRELDDAPTAPSSPTSGRTSPMTSDPVRAQFEAWAKENGYSLYRHNGAAYSSFLTQNVWAAWQAALAAQEGGGERVTEGYKEAAIAWAVCASIHREYAKGRDPFYKTRQADYVKAQEAARIQALRAAQEGTGNG